MSKECPGWEIKRKEKRDAKEKMKGKKKERSNKAKGEEEENQYQSWRHNGYMIKSYN